MYTVPLHHSNFWSHLCLREESNLKQRKLGYHFPISTNLICKYKVQKLVKGILDLHEDIFDLQPDNVKYYRNKNFSHKDVWV